MTSATNLDPEPYLYLTTHGRTSGLSREIEIWFTAHDDRFYVIAEHLTSSWLLNLRANPEVQVRVGEKTFPARTRVLSSETDLELIQTVQELSRKKYGWGDGLVVELTPRI